MNPIILTALDTGEKHPVSQENALLLIEGFFRMQDRDWAALKLAQINGGTTLRLTPNLVLSRE